MPGTGPGSPVDHPGHQIRSNPNPDIAPKTLRMRNQKRASLPKHWRSSTLDNTSRFSDHRPRTRGSRRTRSPTSRALRNRTSRSNPGRGAHQNRCRQSSLSDNRAKRLGVGRYLGFESATAR